jgi:hypothetical protein
MNADIPIIEWILGVNHFVSWMLNMVPKKDGILQQIDGTASEAFDLTSH